MPTLESETLKNPYLKENKNQKVPTPSKYLTDYSSIISKLTWSHYVRIFSLKDQNEILYYINLVISDRLSVRQLESRIKSKEYYRLDEKTRSKLIKLEETSAIDYVKNPILIKNNNNYSEITEKILQTLILEDLPSFLKELGNGFSFISNEYKIKLGERYNYIDLLLFNIEYNCYVVVELKVTELKKEHIGQIELYMNYIDKTITKPTHDKTIGIIISKKNNRFVIEYCSDPMVISREYQLI